jgi:aspartate kinase
MSSQRIVVQKYGGATLADAEKIKAAAKRIRDLHQSGVKVVAVVSAMGKTTNQLIDLARQVSTRPHMRELDMLLTAGERISMSLLSMALNDLGCPAISFTGSQAGILTDDSHFNAQIIDVKAFRVEQALNENKVVILAGFQGVSPQTKEITTLGRGGSDISAVSMAAYLKADRCEVLKDVAGVFSADPKLEPSAKLLPELTYSQLDDMTTWGAQVLNHKSVKLAEEKKVPIVVNSASDASSKGTVVRHSVEEKNNRALAINSFAKILKINLKEPTGFDQLQIFLQKEQIGYVQLLAKNENNIFVTAPDETLATIQNYDANNPCFQVLPESLSSVSITFSSSPRAENIEQCLKIMKSENLEILLQISSARGLHFVLRSENRTRAIKALHSLCIS